MLARVALAGPSGPRASVALALLATGAVACSAVSSSSVPHGSATESTERTSTATAALSGPVTRSQAIANAEQWVAAKLLYCQSANGQPDYDTSCSSTCKRESNPAWDPYRSDCSGFVSWAWELAAPGLVTSEFAPFDTSVTSTIACTDMKPGDAANKTAGGHIVLFESWVTPGKEALFLEEPGCSASEPYAHEFQSAVTCSGDSVDIAYEGEAFTAIRYAKIVDDPADAGSGSGGAIDAGTSSGGPAKPDAGTSGGSSGGSSGGGVGPGEGKDAGVDGGESSSGGGTHVGGAGEQDSGTAPAVWDTSTGGSGTGCSMSAVPGSDGGLVALAPLAFAALARRRRFAAKSV